MNEASLILGPGREKSLLRHHPWIYSGAIARLTGNPVSGDTVRIVGADGRFLAWGAFSARSNIRARVWSFVETEFPDEESIARRIDHALRLRTQILPPAAQRACRLVHAESDGLPGIVADRYGDLIVLQISTAGAERWRDTVASALIGEVGCSAVLERSDLDVRVLEGLEPRSGWLIGEEPEVSEIEESGLHFRVDAVHGHKTGFYLDQRDNRVLVRQFSAGRTVLDCFCYSGGFSLSALAGGAAHVTAVDSSADALGRLRENLAVNGMGERRIAVVEADVFTHLRHLRDAGACFDLIVLDPPKLAPTHRHAEKAARAYKDVNLLAFKLLAPDGLLVTFSCSGGVSRELFRKIVAGAASDAHVDAQVIHELSAAPDHPVMLAFPEGEYLKGLVCRKA